ncbi:hypothetical protein [Nocardioides solisilvae]|uniref:hypothetical protein n=1 Tax=Nocardioides solisilvae TaxID=1542435 RepID=UPI000D744E30|nr:hypothetical protein [Nocardioides solisilvae]
MRLPAIRFRRPRPPAHLVVAPGERALAWSGASDGRVAAGSREAFYVAGPDADVLRLPWEQVEAADWDGDAETLRVVEVGAWGEPRRAHELVLDEPRPLVELVRERVTASVVLQRHVPVAGRRGVRVIARRAPGGSALHWVYEFDEGVDPESPEVRSAAAAALAQLQAEVGLD